MAALNIAAHIPLLPLVFQQVLLEVTRMAVGALTDMTLIQAATTSGILNQKVKKGNFPK